MSSKDWGKKKEEMSKRHDTRTSGTNKKIESVEIDKIFPNPQQPRKFFDEASIEELAGTIKEHGLIQPITITESYDADKNLIYFLLSGERRLRASKLAGKKTIEAIIVNDITIDNNAVIALIENIQRKDLSPIEEAEALENIRTLKNCSDKELSEICGKSYQHTRSLLSLTALSDEIKNGLRENNSVSIQVLEKLSKIEDKAKMIKIFNDLKIMELNKKDGLKYIEAQKQICYDEVVNTDTIDIKVSEVESVVSQGLSMAPIEKYEWGSSKNTKNMLQLNLDKKNLSEESIEKILNYIKDLATK